MELSVKVDRTALLAGFAEVKSNQIPFAMKNALNATGLQFQRVQIAHDKTIFAQRRATWQEQSVKVTHFATKTEQWVTIGIHPPGGDARADILSKFEDQTQKTAFTGHSVAVPTAFIRRNKTDIIPQNLFPSALNLHAVGGSVVGDQRTFLVRTKSGGHVILQRIGRGKRSITAAIWTFKRSVPITPDLDFISDAKAVVESGWSFNFIEAFAQAMATAR